jgi:hypothetical protein
MSDAGMDVASYSTVFRRNLITDCGVGVRSYAGDDYFYENTILRMASYGIHFWPGFGPHVEGNVIGRCGAAGIMVWAVGNLTFLANTVYNNGGSGIELQPPFTYESDVVARRNIVFGNTGWGLQIGEPQRSVSLGCNDWFGNTMGAVSGAPLSSEDMLVDPLFCDLGKDDVTLFAGSPLLTQQTCGAIGARGVGCSTPNLKSLDVTSNRAGLSVAWRFDAVSAVESWLERTDQDVGVWDSLGTGSPTGSNSFELLDQAVAPSRAYDYRIAWRDRGAIVRGSPVSGSWTDAGRLSSASPNPARGEVTIDWVLARPGGTEIQVFDLAGREVSTVARGTFGVGRHQARWDGRGIAPAGMYIVRVTSAERTTSHRVLLLR